MRKQMNEPIGWLVRVGGQPVWDGVYDTVIYIAGYEKPEDAKAAVKAVCQMPDDLIEVLPGAVVRGCGPQPVAEEVRLLPGAA